MDAKGKASDCDKVDEASERVVGKNNKVNIGECNSVVNVEASGSSVDTVDLTSVCHAVVSQSVDTGGNEEPWTGSRRLPRSDTRMRHKCGHCGKICPSLALLQEHYTSHGAEDCPVPQTPAAKIQFRLSRRGMSKKHPSCWVCGRVCSSLAILKEHFALKHSAEDQSILSDDKLLRSRAYPLQDHLSGGIRYQKKRARRYLLCDLCGKISRNSQEFNEHSCMHDRMVSTQETEDAVVHFDDAECRYVCEICGKVCSRPSALASHRRFHVGDRVHSCAHCGQTFTMKKNLVRHQRRHTDERGLICEHCGRSFMHRASLRDHKSRQHRDEATAETDDLSFGCKRCGERFGRISLLRRHIVALHRPLAPKERILCTLCGRSFSCKFTLTMHLRLHSGERPHRCADCDRSFPTRAALRHHAFSHTNSQPHVCSTCGKRFDVPSALANHERVHSSDVKPLGCDRCGRVFSRNHHLKRHVQLTHANDKS